MRAAPSPKPFRTAAHFRAWLEKHHASAKELLIRCYKNHAKDKGATYFEAVDEALCFGWIDGVRRSIDEDTFSVRFTPRRPGSKWSAVNVKRATVLENEGRMRPSGLTAFRVREEQPSRRYSYESERLELAPAYLKKLRANARAWAYFKARPPWYQRTCGFWVMEAKREETRIRRLEALITCSADERPIAPLRTSPRDKAPSRTRKS